MTLETHQGDEWINNDAVILQRMVRVPVATGTECTIEMPFGEPIVAILEKMNVGSANAFCELVRGTYSERRTSKEAASAERHAELAQQREDEQATVETVVSLPETSIQIDFMDPEAVSARCIVLAGDIALLQQELDVLYVITGVLNDAPKVSVETPDSVPPTDEEGDPQSVDQEARPQEVTSDGSGEAGEDGEGV